MVQSLLYVSVRRRTQDPAVHDVYDIVACARARNPALDLTGALVATPHYFAQILEGPGDAIELMMTSVARDRRHSDLLRTPIEQRAQRDFHRWSLAYHGESSYVSELIAAALEEPAFELPRHAQNIRSLMAMFV